MPALHLHDDRRGVAPPWKQRKKHRFLVIPAFGRTVRAAVARADIGRSTVQHWSTASDPTYDSAFDQKLRYTVNDRDGALDVFARDNADPEAALLARILRRRTCHSERPR